MSTKFSTFASSIKSESAFDVLAVAKRLKQDGKDVIELEIGDSPFPSSPSAIQAGIAAIQEDHCHYGPSLGIPSFRAAAAEYVNAEYGLQVKAENIVAGPGAKTFQQFFLEAFVNPGDGVLVFSPYFPTYEPNIHRRGARMVLANLQQAHAFRPQVADIEAFLANDPSPKAIFLNSPHNPTGGITTQQDLRDIADVIHGRDVFVFSDEPYDQMVWEGRHHSLLEMPGMSDQCVAAYTFSKSFSMSGWRLGWAVSSPAVIELIGKLTNTALSCVPPFTQMAGAAVLANDRAERDVRMQDFHDKVRGLVASLNQIDGVECLMPGGSFYAFPSVVGLCQRLGITSHGLAMFLLEAADDTLGVACLGGECFGAAGAGFLRLSCAEPNERLQQAVAFLQTAVQRQDRLASYLDTHPQYVLAQP
ncbi:MAG: aminotransferase [Blastopirellula sp.]|nr:aminotransferase [Blastopirellula sp.]